MTSFLDRLMGRDLKPSHKASTGGPWLAAYAQGGINLSAWGQDYQSRAEKYLAAYSVGWFYKAGSRISRDFAQLTATLAYEDDEGDNAEEITAPASNVPWRSLKPLEQLLRLWERPNPYQTGRAFRQRCQIHLDFAGRTLVWLEGGDGGGMPTALYGISPHRMWPSVNAQGRLVGWVLDKNAPSGGIPFSADEIMVVEYPGVGDVAGADPMGVVQAVYAQVPLTGQMAQHTSDVLATGGRLAGMIWPKDRALSEDEYQDAQRAFRSVASDPNAARRLLVFPEPMEYDSGGAASPKELAIPELSGLTQQEILTAFPIHPFLVGVPLATGMNSGESLRYVKSEYWEGTMHPRVEVWEDAVQFQLIPRYEKAIGRPLDFDIEEPNLDDATVLIEKVGAFKGMVSIGLDPKEALQAVRLDHIKFLGLPELLDPAAQAEMAKEAAAAKQPAGGGSGTTVSVGDTNRRDASQTQQTVVGKAITRDEVFGRAFPGLQKAVSAFLVDQRARVVAAIEATMPKAKADRMKASPDDWWDAEGEDKRLREALREVYVSIGTDALQAVATNTNRILSQKAVDRVLEDVLARSGLRITDINETTRKTIAETLDIGTKRGYSIPQLVNGVEGEGYGGVQGALTANGINVWDTYRAEIIARTETMAAYNEAALTGYKQVNVQRVEAIDGDSDPDCADRNGRVYPVDEALGIADHPNGTLDWVPLT